MDREGRVLLLHGWDPLHPESPYWFTIGGAVEDGETLVAAAARELQEEVGIAVEGTALGDPVASTVIEFEWGGIHFVQDQTFFAVTVDGPDISLVGMDAWEQATIDSYGWWHADDLEAAGGAAHPDVLDAMRLAVARQRVAQRGFQPYVDRDE